MYKLHVERNLRKMKKGRDKRLIKLRDQKLIERYYYWTEVKRRRFDDAILILSESEFFISQQRVLYIIRQNNSLLNKMINDNKNQNQLSLFETTKVNAL